LTGLPEQVRNLRSTLLRGSPYATEIEERSLDDAEYAMQDQLPNLFGIGMVDDSPSEVDFSRLTSTVKLELAVILRRQVATSVEMVDHVPTKDPSVDERGPVCMITPQEFHTMRSLLEDFGDLSMLADIINTVTSSLDGNVLAFVADTLNYNRLAFTAIGAFGPLFAKTAMRYVAIRTIRFPERELLISLTDLARTAGSEGHLLQALAYDLSRHDQKNSVAACSPVSDTMVEVSHSAALDSDEEIDRILSSGTSMDQQIMTRVFGKIIINLEEQVKKNSSPSGNHTIWLNRLRSFDESAFDAMVTEWLGSLLVNQQAKLCHAALPPLVMAGCATLAQVLDIAKDRISKRKVNNQDDALRICMTALDLLLPSERINPLCPVQEAYRYRLEQRKFSQDSEGAILRLIREIVELSSTSLTPAIQNQITSLFSSNRVRTVLRHFALQGTQLFATALGIGSESVGQTSSLKNILDGLLDPSNKLGMLRCISLTLNANCDAALSQRSLEDQVGSIVDAADYLSLPFCQLEIRQLFSMTTADAENSVDTISSALLEAVKSAVEKDESPWSDLITGLETNLTNKVCDLLTYAKSHLTDLYKIREHAERELLSASAFLSSPSALDTERSFKEDEAFIQKYLTVIAFTCSDTVKGGQASIFTALVERFKGAGDAFSKLSDGAKPYIQLGTASPIAFLCLWYVESMHTMPSRSLTSLRINALLRLTVVQGSMSLQKVPNQHQAALLWSLRLLLTQPALEAHPSLAQYVFDVASLLSDAVSEDVRNHLARLDMAKPVDDARSAFLFGSTPSPDGWLALARPVVSPTTSAAASQVTLSPAPQSTPSTHTPSPQQPFQTTPSPAPTLQRSQSQHQQQPQGQQQNHNRMFSQYPQHPSNTHQNKMMAQFQQRMASPGGQNTNQLQQLQQMQAMQQRSTQPSPVQMQRQQSQSSPGPGNQAQKPGMQKQEKEMRTIPFAVKRWEILPESGGNPQANETAISMTLFGARKV
jgi:mediator of RNA polymerase II transcription subunit 12